MKSRQKILTEILSNGYAIVDRFVDPRLVDLALKEYIDCIRVCGIHAQGESFNPIDLDSKPWRKQAIGSRNGSGDPYPQLLQTTYFSPKANGYSYLECMFNKVIGFRNDFINIPSGYGDDFSQDEFWNARRIHHYPPGGGFMSEHKDTRFPSMLCDFDIPFLQTILLLSNRGEEFTKGGGYVVNSNGKREFIENNHSKGSLVIFDGSVPHGVDDIDPHKLFCFSSEKGRIALLVNLYPNIYR